jgi:hypothetical protein
MPFHPDKVGYETKEKKRELLGISHDNKKLPTLDDRVSLYLRGGVSPQFYQTALVFAFYRIVLDCEST